MKIHTTGRFYFKPDGEMVNQSLLTLEEMKAIVDEAHRLGMFVATHSYGGDGLKIAIEAGVDDIQHATAATDEDIKMILPGTCRLRPRFWTIVRTIPAI